MKPKFKVVVLAVSHLAVFVIGAAAFGGYLIQKEFETAAQDPLHRVGLTTSMQRTDKKAHPSVDAELTALSGKFRPPTADVIRLAVLLDQGRLEDAALACSSLAWPRCDQTTLAGMREALKP